LDLFLWGKGLNVLFCKGLDSIGLALIDFYVDVVLLILLSLIRDFDQYFNEAVNVNQDWILWDSHMPYICRDCGYEGTEVLVTTLDRQRTEVRCPKCGSYRVHVALEKVE
jgi:DNA-directed RNA polymerase subunit RPC12/RpoP